MPPLPRRVLVVDDNVDAAETLAELLRDSGYDARTAHDGAAALAEAARVRPDVILLDISMPELDGYEVARRLRDREEMRRTTLVALTGFGDERHRKLAREAGFDTHIAKPVDIARLEQLIEATA